MSTTYEKRLGHRKIYAIPRPENQYEILSDCPIHPEAVVRFTVPAAAAAEYFETDGRDRRPVQEIFPDLRPEHREILINGTSPAEWDRMLGRRIPKDEAKFRKKYAPLGYTFDD